MNHDELHPKTSEHAKGRRKSRTATPVADDRLGSWSLRLSDYLGRAMKDEPTRPGSTSSPALRERFLKALDADDYSALRRMCSDLRACTDILPSTVCASLGLPRGSTYAKAAETIVAA